MSKELNGRNGKTVGTQEYLDAINKNVGISTHVFYIQADQDVILFSNIENDAAFPAGLRYK